MIFYHIGAIIKIIVGGLVIYYLYNFINIYEDPHIAFPFLFLGSFFVIWGFSFFIFYSFQKIFSKQENFVLASKSYKLSLLLGFFLLINLALIILEKWSKGIGIGILIIFVILQLLTIENEE